jgi:ATP-dependent Clp protease ATP-binding subunit ClpC
VIRWLAAFAGLMPKRHSSLMSLARAEAVGFGHEYVGTEHLLLAMAGRKGSAAARALASHGVARKVLLAEIRKSVQPGLGEVPERELPCNPYAKRTIERSIEEARRLEHDLLEQEHVLLALLTDQESVAVEVLTRLGVGLDLLRAAVLKEAGWL